MIKRITELTSLTMEMIFVSVGAAVALLGFFFTRWQRTKTNFPPGPSGLPLLGYLPFLGRHPPHAVQELSKRYGPAVTLKMGTKTVIFLNNYDIIKQALVKKFELFSGRPLVTLSTDEAEIGPVALSYGSDWEAQKSFGLRCLTGSGMERMDKIIVEEARSMLEVILKMKDKSFNCSNTISTAVAKTTSRIFMGENFVGDDEQFISIIKSVEFIPEDSPVMALLLYIPFLKNLPFFSGVYDRLQKRKSAFRDAMKRLISQHRRTSSNPDDENFMDKYIREIDEGKHPSFHDRQLIYYLWNILFAGLNGQVILLKWCLLCLGHFPKHQERIWEEIYDVLGQKGIPSFEAMKKMPYTRAFLQELLRHRTITPFSVAHRTTGDATLLGYDIPKDTTVVANLWAVNHDPKHFKNPEEFRPQRFLDASGHFITNEYMIPFSTGPRKCLGASLVQMQIFLFLVCILQKFKIQKDHKKPLPSLEKGLVVPYLAPEKFDISFFRR